MISYEIEKNNCVIILWSKENKPRSRPRLDFDLNLTTMS